MRLGLSTLRNSSIEHLVVGRDGHAGVQRSLDSRVTPTYEMSVVVLDGYVPPGFILVPVGWISLRIHQTRGSCSHLIVKKYPRRWIRLGLSTLRNSSIEHLVVGWDGHVGVQRSLDSRLTPTYEMSVVVLDSYVPPGFILVPVGWISLRIHQTRDSCSHLIVKNTHDGGCA